MKGLQYTTVALLLASLVVAGAQSGDSGEGARTVNLQPTLGFKLNLGAVEPVQTLRSEHGIWGAAPDGPLTVEVVGGETRTFFSCLSSTGAGELSCLARTPSLAAFTSYGALYQQPDGNFQTVMAGAVSGDYYQGGYSALMSTWKDPNGTIHGWYHAENHQVPNCPNSFWASIGYAYSTDGGLSFTKVGPVVVSAVPPTDSTSTNCSAQGAAEPKVIARSDSYLYMMYDAWNPLDWFGSGMALARAPQSAPDQWTKYYNGAFTEPGVGGQFTPVVLRVGNSQPWAANVSWNATLGKYVLLHHDFANDGAILVRTSTNLTTWTAAQVLMPTTTQHAYRYASWAGGYLYFGRKPLAATDADNWLARRTIAIR